MSAMRGFAPLLVVTLFAAVVGCSTNEPEKPMTKAEMVKELLRNPQTRQLGIDIMRRDAGLPPEGYGGNCPYDSDYDVAGNRCGERSAESRLGGY